MARGCVDRRHSVRGVSLPCLSMGTAATKGDDLQHVVFLVGTAEPETLEAFLAERRLDINQISAGLTPLGVAAQLGKVDAARVLISHRANVDFAAPQQSLPLFVAADNGHRKLAELLVFAGADVFKSGVDSRFPWVRAIHRKLEMRRLAVTLVAIRRRRSSLLSVMPLDIVKLISKIVAASHRPLRR